MKIFAHRGCSGHYPENTLAAFEAALTSGCDGIEMDVFALQGERLTSPVALVASAVEPVQYRAEPLPPALLAAVEDAMPLHIPASNNEGAMPADEPLVQQPITSEPIAPELSPVADPLTRTYSVLLDVDDAGNKSEIVRVNCVLDTMAPAAVTIAPQIDGTRYLGIVVSRIALQHAMVTCATRVVSCDFAKHIGGFHIQTIPVRNDGGGAGYIDQAAVSIGW